MFRNIYIEAYKTSIQQNSTLQVMMIHINHMYAGMGCILQDIQFMVANVLTHINKTNNNTNIHNKTGVIKNQGGRISMPERLDKIQKVQQFTFKMPRYEFLPSSSMKYQNLDILKQKIEQPQQVRSNNIPQNIAKRNDSFQEMFPQKKYKTRHSQTSSFDGNSKTQGLSSTRPALKKSQEQAPPPPSQEDFMDYLFKKNKS